MYSCKQRMALFVCALATVSLLSACTTVFTEGATAYGIDGQDITPRIGGDREAVNNISAVERAHLQLIATNMVSTLVQIPSMRSGAVTVQINLPQTAYGNAIVRALEDAGFGLQTVSADQGKNYVSYKKSVSETESGVVTDYELTVGKVSLRREFSVQGDLIYPSSLMTIDGTNAVADIQLSDSIFAEQGGRDDSFISGVQLDDAPDSSLTVESIDVRDYDELPAAKRTPQAVIFEQARQHFFEIQARKESPPLDQLEKHRRTVLIFDDTNTQVMGPANKQAVRTLVREFGEEDVMLIKACLDADGQNESDMNRAIRVEQELLGFGIPPESTYIAPCVRASYRHASDDSPAPVELVHYRPGTL